MNPNNDEIKYVSNIEGDSIKLRRSKSSYWTDNVRGENIGNLIDTGDYINLEIGDVKLNLDYSEFSELFRLMELKVLTDDNLMSEIEYIGLDE